MFHTQIANFEVYTSPWYLLGTEIRGRKGCIADNGDCYGNQSVPNYLWVGGRDTSLERSGYSSPEISYGTSCWYSLHDVVTCHVS